MALFLGSKKNKKRRRRRKMREEKKGKKKKFDILREIKPEHYSKQTNSNTYFSLGYKYTIL